jgi:small subunit ribosomal protein S4
LARYIGPVCRLCRVEGTKLFLKGERCNTNKCSVERRRYRPGQHGQARQKVSEYGIRLKEKQKLRRIYGLLEDQFRGYYEKAAVSKGVTGETLLQLLETRLDNVVYRLGFATSRAQARKFVTHGHVTVNGKRVDIASFHVKAGQVIAVKESSQKFVKAALEGFNGNVTPNWVATDLDKLSGQVLTVPVKEEIDTSGLVKENLVVEFYSK